MLFGWLKEAGLIFIILMIILIVFVPLIVVLVLGVYIANRLGLTGIVWWSFLVIFWIILTGIMGKLS